MEVGTRIYPLYEQAWTIVIPEVDHAKWVQYPGPRPFYCASNGAVSSPEIAGGFFNFTNWSFYAVPDNFALPLTIGTAYSISIDQIYTPDFDRQLP